MRKLVILFLLTGCVYHSTTPKHCMTVSEALPIKMWTNDEITFNERLDQNVDLQCFFQEFHNDDEIRLQIADDGDFAYQLVIEDEDENELERLDFVFTASPTGRHDVAFTPSLLTPAIVNQKIRIRFIQLENIVLSPDFADSSKWANSGAGGNWTIEEANTHINFTGSAQESKELVNDTLADSYSGDIRVRVVMNQSDSADVVNIRVGLGATDHFFATDGLGDYTFDEIVSGVPSFSDIEVQASSPGTDTKLITLYSVHVFPVSDGVEVMRSDLIRLSSSPEANVVIKYKSPKNFDLLVYNTEDTYYTFRLKGRFYYGRKKTEQQSEELSDSVIIVVASSAQKQQLLTVNDAPDYFHDQIVAILQHGVSGSVRIPVAEGGATIDWVMADGYDYVQPESDGYPFQAANVYLTDKNYFVRNLM